MLARAPHPTARRATNKTRRTIRDTTCLPFLEGGASAFHLCQDKGRVARTELIRVFSKVAHHPDPHSR